MGRTIEGWTGGSRAGVDGRVSARRHSMKKGAGRKSSDFRWRDLPRRMWPSRRLREPAQWALDGGMDGGFPTFFANAEMLAGCSAHATRRGRESLRGSAAQRVFGSRAARDQGAMISR